MPQKAFPTLACAHVEHPALPPVSRSYSGAWGRSVTHYSPVRHSHPGSKLPGIPFDLHVLSTPPAFILSQNRTLHKKLHGKADTTALKKQETDEPTPTGLDTSKTPTPITPAKATRRTSIRKESELAHHKRQPETTGQTTTIRPAKRFRLSSTVHAIEFSNHHAHPHHTPPGQEAGRERQQEKNLHHQPPPPQPHPPTNTPKPQQPSQNTGVSKTNKHTTKRQQEATPIAKLAGGNAKTTTKTTAHRQFRGRKHKTDNKATPDVTHAGKTAKTTTRDTLHRQISGRERRNDHKATGKVTWRLSLGRGVDVGRKQEAGTQLDSRLCN